MEFKKAIVPMFVSFSVFIMSACLYALVDLNQREADEKMHDSNCRSCALIVKEMKDRQITPLALR